MSTEVAERRQNVRVAASYAVSLADRKGRFIARGRTANISQSGLLAVLDLRRPLAQEAVQVKVTVPAAGIEAGRKGAMRTVIYSARVVRQEQVGHLTGVAVDFLQKIS